MNQLNKKNDGIFIFCTMIVYFARSELLITIIVWKLAIFNSDNDELSGTISHINLSASFNARLIGNVPIVVQMSRIDAAENSIASVLIEYSFGKYGKINNQLVSLTLLYIVDS